MHAILNGDHRRFCKLVQNIKEMQREPDTRLTELETEFNAVYDNYQQRLGDIKCIVEEYEQTQKALRTRMRQLMSGKNISQPL